MRLWAAFTLFCLSLMPLPAFADIDHQCLKQCVESGAPSSICMTQCSYNVPLVNPSIKTPPQTHNVLSAPQPVDQDAVILKPKIIKPVLTKDYACMAQCLKISGAIYQACEERCTIPDCTSASSLCRTPTALPTAPALPASK